MNKLDRANEIPLVTGVSQDCSFDKFEKKMLNSKTIFNFKQTDILLQSKELCFPEREGIGCHPIVVCGVILFTSRYLPYFDFSPEFNKRLNEELASPNRIAHVFPFIEYASYRILETGATIELSRDSFYEVKKYDNSGDAAFTGRMTLKNPMSFEFNLSEAICYIHGILTDSIGLLIRRSLDYKWIPIQQNNKVESISNE